MVNGATRITVVRERKALREALHGRGFSFGGYTTKPGLKMSKWESFCDLTGADCKKFVPIKDADGKVIDYSNVTISGYLSTFGNVTASDRDGDVVEAGAFKETIQSFMKNPVLLMDHWNSVENIAGRFTEVREDGKGLFVTATISDSQTDKMRHVRALVAEGNLKTLSMGGRFSYRDDGRTIFKVDLYEGSLVSIPANPDALFSVRAMTEAEIKEVQDQTVFKGSKPSGVKAPGSAQS